MKPLSQILLDNLYAELQMAMASDNDDRIEELKRKIEAIKLEQRNNCTKRLTQ